ncbi:alpha-actinin [Ordospora colligata]|uniref:Ca2+-binding actin-bundling fimbrin/plastin n=1 Tax=Ordospora colligata OC4 TaxID=1354746 RepID=A0A0B2UFJ3_9MICR|nr:Ca2+-binding actin-bundling fimbrin/plastin [Ordospora colligata OC4]KHN69836.1 Ca2+-binding actin-bundling fimbrin/plastin [Ordospora colligata OC4]TBU16219.1 Ca2+-binding actin-bundling fimbrin/plastin [Ordospora colligata]
MTQEEKEWEKVQEKTFTKWVNDKLIKSGNKGIENIFKDLCDGVKLARLLMALQEESVEYNSEPYTRIQKMENVERILMFIKRKNVKLINIGPEDIVDGNPKLILGLIWSLISRMAIADIALTGDLSIRSELLRWCKEVTSGYKGVRINDFSRSWQDGIAFNAIIHKFRPDLICNFEELEGLGSVYNLQQAFKVAEQHLGIKRLLDVEDVADVAIPDERSVMTYVAGYYERFKEYEQEKRFFNKMMKVLSMTDWSIQSRNLYEIKAKGLQGLIKELVLQRNEVCSMIRKLDESFSRLLEMNTNAIQEAAGLRSLLGSLSVIHEAYMMKKYIPPDEVKPERLEFPRLELRKIADSIGMKKIFDNSLQNEMDGLNDMLDKFKEGFSEDKGVQKQMENAIELKNALDEMKCIHQATNDHHDKLKDVVEKKIEVLKKVDDRSMERIKMLGKAKELFTKTLGNDEYGISISGMCWCMNQMGLSVDESMIPFGNPEGKICLDDYLLIVNETYNSSFDLIELKKAFNVFSKNGILDLTMLGVDANNLKNIYHINRNERNLDVNEFFEKFIEN